MLSSCSRQKLTKTTDDTSFLKEVQETGDRIKQLFLIAQPKNLQAAIRQLLSNQSFYELCKAPELEDYWENVWRIFGKKTYQYHTSVMTPDFEFKPLDKVHPVDLIGGYSLFHNHRLQELTNPKNSNDQLLLFAATRGSIQAQQKLNLMSMSEKNPQLKKIKLESAIRATEALIEVYGSYAAMMLADLYYELSKEDQEAQTKVVSYLKLSSALHHSSENAIHNASFGQGLNISNRFEIDEPEDALGTFQSMHTDAEANFLNTSIS